MEDSKNIESVFGNKEYVEKYQKIHGLNSGFVFSDSFLNCANKKLTIDFMRKTGVKSTKRVFLSAAPAWIIFGNPTKLYLSLVLNDSGFADYVWVSYQSKSGRLYRMHEEDWDSNDVDFWFEDLDAAAINARLNYKTKLPFSTKNLAFELEVNGLHLSGSILADISSVGLKNASVIAMRVIGFVHDCNQKAEKKNEGVVHRIDYRETETGIMFYIDYGTVGISFLKKLLAFMNGLNCFDKITLDSSSLY